MNISPYTKIHKKNFVKISTVKGNIQKARQSERDIYGMFSKKIFIPSDMNYSKVAKKSSVIVRMKKNKKIDGFNIFIYPKSKKFPFPHPVVMGRLQKGEKQ